MFQTFPNHQADKNIVTISCWWNLPCFMFQWTSHWSTGSSGYQNDLQRLHRPAAQHGERLPTSCLASAWMRWNVTICCPSSNIDIDSASSGGLEDYIPLDSLQSSDSQGLCWLGGGNTTQLFPLQNSRKNHEKPCWGSNHKQRWCCCSHQRPQHSWIQRRRGLHGETDPRLWGFTCDVSMYPSIQIYPSIWSICTSKSHLIQSNLIPNILV